METDQTPAPHDPQGAGAPPAPAADPAHGADSAHDAEPVADPAADAAWQAIAEPAAMTLPDFAAIAPTDLRAAGRRAVAQQAEAIAAIVASEAPATFHNTTLQIELARYPALRLAALVRLYSSALATPEAEPVYAQLDAELHAAELDVLLSPELFARLEAVSLVDLLPEDRRHHELTVADFVHAGARLDEESRQAAATISAELSSLETEFGQVLLAETNDSALHVPPEDAQALAGLSPVELGAAAQRAADRGVPGWVLGLQSTSQQSALCELTDTRTRQALMTASLSRGSRGNDNDTRVIVSDITALRAALAGLMGYRTYAGYAIDEQLAGDPEDASALLTRLLAPAQEQLAAELAAIREDLGIKRIEQADLAHLLRAYGEREFGIDVAAAAKYFEFDRVLGDGVLYAASQLYGLEFRPSDQRGWHPDVRVIEALENGRPLGLICLDPYARDSKRGGAWMDQLVPGAWYTGEHPIVTLTLNLPKPAPGEPTLLAPDSVRTLFHEFGHVLHGLFADSTYPSRAGTSVPRDYVEFPSQLNEMWMFHPQVLPNYAVHVETGEGIPDEIVDRLTRAQAFGQGFATVEYLAAALLDLGWHSLESGEQVDAVLSFESEVLAASGFDPLVPPRYRSPYFAHVFSHGYAAGYYSYLWSEVLAAHAEEWFAANGGLDHEAGQRFRKALLAPGYSVDLEAAVEDFFGAQPGIAPLLRRRGLPVPDEEEGPAPAADRAQAPGPEAVFGDAAALPSDVDEAEAGGTADARAERERPEAAVVDGGADQPDGAGGRATATEAQPDGPGAQPGAAGMPAAPSGSSQSPATGPATGPQPGVATGPGTGPVELPAHIDRAGTADLGALFESDDGQRREERPRDGRER
ncbi:M3 family metallopeptidase [Brevibacterium sp. BRM-1]|nr:M3 family metallopeptidase [Brevibacterium sp. BRM-1]WAL39217.1 M3 family metallopeptidase [Brevibacterium sp. BRM-1]